VDPTTLSSIAAAPFPAMSLSNGYPRTLDPTLLHLNEQEAVFLKSQTGIRDDEALKNHIIEVQKRACEVFKSILFHL
jgi:hypothetical protein